MSIDKAIKILEGRIRGNFSDREKSIFKEVIALLNELKQKTHTEQEVSEIEDLIEAYIVSDTDEFNTNINIEMFKKQLANRFTFLPLNYFSNIGLALGLIFGIGIGVAFGVPVDHPHSLFYGILIGGTAGIFAGLLFGRMLDKGTDHDNKMLKDLE